MTKAHAAVFDLVRLVAALLVMFFHLGFVLWSRNTIGREMAGAAPEMLNWWSLAWPGFVGVPIFFVLSGYLISRSAERSSPAAFLGARVLRLLPMAWACALINALVLTAWNTYPTDEIVARLFRELVFHPYGPWLSRPFWTLGVEISFYAIVLLLIATNGGRWRGAVFAVIGSASGLYWISRASADCQIGDVGLCNALSSFPRTQEILLVQHGCFFALGVLIQMRNIAGVWLLLSPLIVAGCILQIQAVSSDYAVSYANAGYTLSLNPLMPIGLWGAATLLIAWPRSNVAPVGSNNPAHEVLRVLSLATYPLYLLHLPCGSAIAALLYRTGIEPMTATICSMLAVISSAIALTLFVEAPVRAVFSAHRGRLRRVQEGN